MYLAAIADSQPQQPAAMPAHQYPPSGIMQQGSSSHYMQAQQQQQQLMAARSSLLYAQQPFSLLQQQLGVTSSSTATPSLHMLQSSEASMGSAGGFPDFARVSTGSEGGRGHHAGFGSSSAEGHSGDDGN
ncbi:hypothetical protein PIB30_032355 [Stylosanthes scabra]|uniref:GRF1-interacting factor 1 n=1 Tax=Stylosanthes scabra TaxID=79078 RepID=A0ABU6TBV8_9FABA|nr:hypothetical protein [Stylosanthes scabra]